MVLVLVIGDFLIPQNKVQVPSKFQKLLVPGKISHALVTGDSISHSIKVYLESICPSIITTSSTSPSFIIKQVPQLSKFQKYVVAEFEGWRFGLAQSSSTMIDSNDLAEKESLARALDAHVFITNGAHQFEGMIVRERFYLDPGSATGAWTVKNPNQESIPSFVLMDVSPNKLTFYIYKLIQDQVKVEKMEFVKPVPESEE